MKLRCKEGDLAIVMYDTPPCAANIGRIVEVRGPIEINLNFGLPCWLIKPVRPEPFLMERGQEVNQEIVDWSSRAEHPDAWLLPLTGLEDGAPDQESEDADTDGPAQQHESLEKPCPVSATSMKYRPRSYFGTADLQVELLGRVKGLVRRGMLKELLDQGKLTDIPDALTRAALGAAEREIAGQIHPMFMGGEYLPTVDEAEVEIARIPIKSTTYDVTSVYARRAGNRIHYRVVDEYGGDTLSGQSTRTSVRPLTMGQLIKFFLGAWDLCLCLECNFEGDLPAMLEFFDGESEFYPCFDSALRRLVRKRFPVQEVT